jgi:hypothetical protein
MSEIEQYIQHTVDLQPKLIKMLAMFETMFQNNSVELSMLSNRLEYAYEITSFAFTAAITIIRGLHVAWKASMHKGHDSNSRMLFTGDFEENPNDPNGRKIPQQHFLELLTIYFVYMSASEYRPVSRPSKNYYSGQNNIKVRCLRTLNSWIVQNQNFDARTTCKLAKSLFKAYTVLASFITRENAVFPVSFSPDILTLTKLKQHYTFYKQALEENMPPIGLELLEHELRTIASQRANPPAAAARPRRSSSPDPLLPITRLPAARDFR